MSKPDPVLAELDFHLFLDADGGIWVQAFDEGDQLVGSTTLAEAIMQAEALWHFLREAARQ